MCKWKANFVLLNNILFISFDHLLPSFEQLSKWFQKCLNLRRRKNNFKSKEFDMVISSCSLRISSSRVSDDFSRARTAFPFSLSKATLQRMFLSTLKSAPSKMTIVNEIVFIFFFRNELETPAIRLHNDFAIWNEIRCSFWYTCFITVWLTQFSFRVILAHLCNRVGH